MERAYKVAELEEECGVRSTFFVLLTCPVYNILDSENSRLLLDIQGAGFEIGLHFDPSIYGDESLYSHLYKEVRILEDVIGVAVRSISLHNLTIYGDCPIFDGYINAYSPVFFSEASYFSDSCGNFRGKDPFQMIQSSKNSYVQMLLHPIFYSTEGTGSFASLRKSLGQRLDVLVAVNPIYIKETIK